MPDDLWKVSQTISAFKLILASHAPKWINHRWLRGDDQEVISVLSSSTKAAKCAAVNGLSVQCQWNILKAPKTGREENKSEKGIGVRRKWLIRPLKIDRKKFTVWKDQWLHRSWNSFQVKLGVLGKVAHVVSQAMRWYFFKNTMLCSLKSFFGHTFKSKTPEWW